MRDPLSDQRRSIYTKERAKHETQIDVTGNRSKQEREDVNAQHQPRVWELYFGRVVSDPSRNLLVLILQARTVEILPEGL